MKSTLHMQKKIIIGVFISLLFISCSGLRYAYNFADWYFLYKLDSYFDINDEQENFFDKQFVIHQNWHRKHELPFYINFLEKLKERFQKGLISEDIPWMQEQYSKIQQNITDRISDDIGTFLSTLTDDQIRYLQDGFKERNETFKERLEWSPEKLKNYYVQRTIDSLEDWFGELTPQQLVVVKETVDMDHQRLKISIGSRLKRQKQFVDLLKRTRKKEELEDKIKEWFLKPELLRTPEYSRLLKKRKESGNQLLVRLKDIMTKKQIETVIEKLDEYISDFRAIHNDKKSV